MRAYKDKQFLVFKFEDNKDVKYDLSTGQTIGKLGKPVKNICSQLRGYDILAIIDSFEDENYKNFLHFVDSRVNRSTKHSYYHYVNRRVNKITNVGTFLSKIQDFSRYEQFFACGIQKVDIEVEAKVTDVPKGLLKLCSENDLELNPKLIIAYKKCPNELNLLMNTDFYSITKPQIVTAMVKAYTSEWDSDLKLHNLIVTYNYKIQSLFKYFDNLITYEALDGLSYIITEFYDYVYMMAQISNKYEKYPKNFLTSHRIATRNYNRLKEIFEEEAFKKRIDKSLEYDYENYKFMYPKSTQDIKDEAVQQNNCVASYIKNVIDGACHILFMRDKESKDKSLVTIEVRNNKIVQARGKFNRDVTEKEQEAIDKWNNAMERKLKKKEKAAC